jgi:predicted nucleic acid-binding protein
MTKYLLDTTVLIAHFRGDQAVAELLLGLLSDGESLCTSCVNVAEIEQGIRPRERRAATGFLGRLEFLPTTREAAMRAGRYRADWERRGKTLQLADALVAGTARAHGAVLLTHNVSDFPMRNIRVEQPITA